MPTTKLNLPLIDGTNTADVVRDMNALANAVDSKAGASDGLATLDATGKVPASQLNVSAPADATTSTKGVVQLSNSTTSTSEVLAATPKAVKDAKDGLSNQIGILSALNTTNKSNLVSAINEVFQTGNNVKSDMVAALLAVDSTLPINSNSTWEQIETATSQIKTGKRFFSGVLLSTNNRISVTGLPFKPSIVIAFRNFGGDNYNHYTSAVVDKSKYSLSGLSRVNVSNGSVGITSNTTITQNGFTLDVPISDNYFYIALE